MKKILILFAHPALEKSRVNKPLIKAAQQLEDVTIHDLYEEYPDFHINIAREQELLLAHDIVIWQHPFFWYSAPSLLKEWIDLVLEFNFAYGPSGKALKGKIIFNSITTGGPQEAYSKEGYNRFSIRELLAPFEQTANLCLMDYFPPFIIHGSLHLETSQLNKHTEEYVQLLEALLNDQISKEDIKHHHHLNAVIKEIIHARK